MWLYSLLVVDDEPIIVEGLAEMLSDSGLPIKNIRMAYSALEALEIYKEMPFDIIITDIKMPEMDGTEFLKRIGDISRSTRVILLTGYKDFEYARQALRYNAADYLLKPVEDEAVIASVRKTMTAIEEETKSMLEINRLKAQMKDSLAHIQGQYLKSLLENTPEDRERLTQRFSSLNLPFTPDRGVSLILARIDRYGKDFNQGDTELIRFMVQNILQEKLGEGVYLQMIADSAGYMTGLIQADRWVYIKKIAEEVQDIFYNLFEILLSFAVGEEANWPLLHESYRYLSAALRQSLKNGTLITNEYDPALLKGKLEIETLNDIRLSIKKRDLKALEKHLDMLLETDALDDKTRLAGLYIELSRHAINMAMEYNIGEILDALYIEKLTNLYTFSSSREMKAFLLQTFRILFGKLGNATAFVSTEMVNRIKTYIQNNLDKDVSLYSLSVMFHINSSYLSRIFHQATGEQLSLYITRVKMEAAKKQLGDDSLKIYEIAKNTGYNNPNYFAKVFKKAVGISPQDYRNIVVGNSIP